MKNRHIAEIVEFIEERCQYPRAVAVKRAQELYSELIQDKREWVVTKYQKGRFYLKELGKPYGIPIAALRPVTHSALKAKLLSFRAARMGYRGWKSRPTTTT